MLTGEKEGGSLSAGRASPADRVPDRSISEGKSRRSAYDFGYKRQSLHKGRTVFGKFQALMKVTDLVLLDLKHIEDAQHKKLTGCTNQNILDMASYLSELGKPVWIRHVLVPGYSDRDEYLKRLSAFIDTLHNVQK